jgi:hypothetical protein
VLGDKAIQRAALRVAGHAAKALVRGTQRRDLVGIVELRPSGERVEPAGLHSGSSPIRRALPAWAELV